MADDSLSQRRKALEDSFFARRNDDLLRELKRRVKSEAQLNLLAEASGITETRVLSRISDVDIRAETVAALSLVPLVEVAWADGFVEDKEIEAVLKAALKSGIQKGSPSYKLLADWLNHKPGPELLSAWKDYIQALRRKLEPATVEQLKKELIQRAHDVAVAAGGFLGIGSISKPEQAKLKELEQAFH